MAYCWMYRDGKLRVLREKLPTGTIIVKPPKALPTGRVRPRVVVRSAFGS